MKLNPLDRAIAAVAPAWAAQRLKSRARIDARCIKFQKWAMKRMKRMRI